MASRDSLVTYYSTRFDSSSTPSGSSSPTFNPPSTRFDSSSTPFDLSNTLSGSSSTPLVTKPRGLRPIIICGPSGATKTALIQRLIESHPDKFSKAVSHTSRQPRRGEVQGKDYHFVPRSFFSNMIYRDCFLEHISYDGEYYGTSKETIESQRQDRIVLLNINMDGVETIKKTQRPCARYVFIKPTCSQALQAELRARGKTASEIRKRVCRAMAEVAHAGKDGSYHIVIADNDMDKAYDELEKFALGT